MVELKPLQDFAPVKEIYLSSFPREERREVTDIEHLLATEPKYHILGVEYGKQLVGFISYWNLNHWSYGEHFAIDNSFRGEGVGASAMKQFLALKENVIIEVEPPTVEIARRRIGFYERLGFQLWDLPYLQPPYRDGDDWLPLCLMTHGFTPTEEVTKQIHRTVYKTSGI